MAAVHIHWVIKIDFFLFFIVVRTLTMRSIPFNKILNAQYSMGNCRGMMLYLSCYIDV